MDSSMSNGKKEIKRRIESLAKLKAPKMIWTVVGVFAIMLLATGCLTNPSSDEDSKPSSKQQEQQQGLDYRRIYEFKTAHMGDASKVGNMTSQLYYSEYKDGISLDTDKSPYALTVNYKMESKGVTEDMFKNASIMFCLIDNVDFIIFNLESDGKSETFVFDRATVEKLFGEDIRKYSDSYENFMESFVGPLNQLDWNGNEIGGNEIGAGVETDLPAALIPKDADEIEKLAYSAAFEKYSQGIYAEPELIAEDGNTLKHKEGSGVILIAPKVYGTYQSGNELKIFATVYYGRYRLYGDTISEVSGGIVPAAIVYTKSGDGGYSFKEYIEAMDGSYFQESIEEFCAPRKDIADKMMKGYSNHEELIKMMKENLKAYLNENGLRGIKLKDDDGGVLPLT